MSLSEARKAARAVLARVDAGADPQEEKLALRRQEASVVKQVLERYEENCRARGLVNTTTVMSTLRRNLRDHLNKRLTELTLVDLLGRVQAIERRSGPGAAQDFRARSSALFTFAMGIGVAASNPWTGYRKPRVTRAEAIEIEDRGRVLEDAEIHSVRQAAIRRGDSFGRIIQFLILSGCRRGEGASLRWDWIVDKEITFPAASIKQGRPHLVPVSLAISTLIQGTPDRGPLCWPSERRVGGDTAVSGWSQLTDDLLLESGIRRFTLHDLRRTFRTWAEERHGATPVLAEAAIGHVNSDTLTRVYSRPQWKHELQRLFQAWGDHVLSIGA